MGPPTARATTSPAVLSSGGHPPPPPPPPPPPAVPPLVNNQPSLLGNRPFYLLVPQSNPNFLPNRSLNPVHFSNKLDSSIPPPFCPPSPSDTILSKYCTVYSVSLIHMWPTCIWENHTLWHIIILNKCLASNTRYLGMKQTKFAMYKCRWSTVLPGYQISLVSCAKWPNSDCLKVSICSKLLCDPNEVTHQGFTQSSEKAGWQCQKHDHIKGQIELLSPHESYWDNERRVAKTLHILYLYGSTAWVLYMYDNFLWLVGPSLWFAFHAH